MGAIAVRPEHNGSSPHKGVVEVEDPGPPACSWNNAVLANDLQPATAQSVGGQDKKQRL
jgi:hypothetical protein